MQNRFFIIRFDPVIIVKMWNIGADKNQVTVFKLGYMLTNMPFAVGAFDIIEFQFGVIMPEIKIVQTRIGQ